MKRAEIRKDYITNRYVIIAPGRKKRPHEFRAQATANQHDNEFSFEKLKPRALDSVGRGEGQIISVANKFPAVTPGNNKAYGYQEVIVETPDPTLRLADLSVAQIKDLFIMYQRRTKFLLKKPRLNYLLCFKNEGSEAGASISHAHSQIFATEIIPMRVVETSERLKEYRVENEHSLYARSFQQRASE
jgi:UDPglucose--hexose-1-phosphate uridylyltransferase